MTGDTYTNISGELREIERILKGVSYHAILDERDRCRPSLKRAWYVLSKSQIAGFRDSLGEYHRISPDEMKEMLDCIAAALHEEDSRK